MKKSKFLALLPLLLSYIHIRSIYTYKKSVEEITKILDEKQSTISKHLAVLKNVGIIDDKKVGLYRFYYLKLPCVLNFSLCVEQTLKEKIKLEKKLIE